MMTREEIRDELKVEFQKRFDARYDFESVLYDTWTQQYIDAKFEILVEMIADKLMEKQDKE